MLHKLIKKSPILLIFLCLISCRVPSNLGFYQPITLNMTVPDGPPEFKAGWYAGCKTALGVGKAFANGWVYGGADFGSGVYQHDSVYQSAWSTAYFNCIAHANNFTEYNSMMKAPLE